MLKNLIYKKTFFILFFYILNVIITFLFNQTNKYMLIRKLNSLDSIYIDKNWGFFLFSIIYILIISLFLIFIKNLKFNFDKKQIQIWSLILIVSEIMLSVFNLKRNLILTRPLSDHLILMISIFISYFIFFWNNLTKLYRVIKIPFIFVNSENSIYVKFQYVYLWIFAYIFFFLIFLSQMISSFDFYYFLIILFVLDIVCKNSYLYYKNLNKAKVCSVLLVSSEFDKYLIGTLDSNLDKKNIKIIKTLGQEIKKEFDIYQCSPLIRSYETLDILSQQLNIFPKIQLNELAIEQNVGFWGDLSNIQLFEQQYLKLMSKESKNKNFETNKKLFKRNKKFLNYLKKYYRSNSILLVSHHLFISNLETYIKNEKITNISHKNYLILDLELFENEIIINTKNW